MDDRTVSRWFGAASLVLGGAAVTLGSLFEVTNDGDSVRAALGKIAAHQSDQRGLVVADMVAVLMLPAMLYLMRLARRGSPRLAISGGVLAFAGSGQCGSEESTRSISSTRSPGSGSRSRSSASSDGGSRSRC
jgi:hypothetical protein